MSRGCFYKSVIITIGFMFILTLGIHQLVSHANSVGLLMLDECNAPPCLFGESLQDANHDQVETILESFPWTLDSSIKKNNGTLEWNWTNPIKTRLEPLSDVPPFYYNYASVDDDGVRVVKLIFSIQLDDLINNWGEPMSLIPYGYTRSGDMEVLLNYGSSQGYFGVLLLCSEPELKPDEQVRFHISARPGFISRRLEMPWLGYTKDLPDCTIFQP